jgi:hypothetical protein
MSAPLASRGEAERTIQGGEPSENSTNTVFLAEDDDAMREAVAATLRGGGYEVREACDGAELLDLLADTVDDPFRRPWGLANRHTRVENAPCQARHFARRPGNTLGTARAPMYAMLAATHSSSTEADWVSVSEQHPCRVCGADAGCRFHSEEPFASCASRRSEWPLTSGDWLHRIDSQLPK